MYLTLLFWSTENLCTVPGMWCTFHVNRCISSHFLKRGIRLAQNPNETLPISIPRPFCPQFSWRQTSLDTTLLHCFPLGHWARMQWGEARFFAKGRVQPGIGPKNCHLRIQPYHMNIRAFPLGIWSVPEKLNFSAWLTTPQSVVDLKKNRYRITSAKMKNLKPRELGNNPEVQNWPRPFCPFTPPPTQAVEAVF